MPPAGMAFGKAVSVDPVRVHNETPMRGLRSRPWGCPGVESSRDPWYMPARALPDPTRTVPDPPGRVPQIRWKRLKKTKLFEGTLRMIYQNRQDAHKDIDHIFKDLLPVQGMPERPEQIALSHRMLEAMQDGGIALCDAGTGIGKTYAYLVAGIVFHGPPPSRPVLVSTSSIALQKAVRDEYLPFLSAVLTVDGMITEPIQAVIRKGKSHYVCDQRLERRLGQLDLCKKNWRAGNALLSLREKLDLDEAPRLSGYDRERVCAPKVCDCGQEDCRYRTFLDSCDGGQYPFQICNHNLLLADAIHRGTGRQPILPDSLAIIIDEAHKLPETARQMFGVTLRAEDIQGLIHDLRREKYLLAADALADTSRLFLRKLERPLNPDKRFSEYARLLVAPNRALTVVRKQVNPLLTPATRRRLDKLASTVALFSEGRPDMVFYLSEDARDTVMLCATVANLTAQLQNTLWTQPRPIILTSGTLAVGSDFHRFREEAGLLEDSRVKPSITGQFKSAVNQVKESSVPPKAPLNHDSR